MTVTEWIPLEGKRKQARPKLRWEDEIRKCAWVTWMRAAANRVEWKRHEEAFILQWIECGLLSTSSSSFSVKNLIIYLKHSHLPFDMIKRETALRDF